MKLSLLCSLLIALAGLACGGCSASYATPGRGADLSALSPQARESMTDDGIKASLERRPLAKLPADIAIVRLQATGYRSPTAQSFGDGAYSVVTTRDVETRAELEKLEHLKDVNGIAEMNRLLLPSTFTGDIELRQAAAKLHADMVLIYTLDTTFYSNDKAAPISVITLGLSPTQATHIVTTASALLIDTRNGYVYGVAEATTKRDGIATAWNVGTAMDEARVKNESAAFAQLVDNFAQTWAGVLAANLPARTASTAPVR